MSKPLLPPDDLPSAVAIPTNIAPPPPLPPAFPVATSTPAPPIVVVAAPHNEPDDADLAEDVTGPSSWSQLPSWLTSMVVHLVLVLCLAMYTYADRAKEGLQLLLGSLDQEGNSLSADDVDAGVIDTGSPTSDVTELPAMSPVDDLAAATTLPQVIGGPTLPELNLPPQLGGPDLPVGGDLATAIGDAVHSQLANRLTSTGRAEAVRKGGGTPGSERAVSYALEWLANHQLPDGSWSFDHRRCRKCRGRCGQAGSLGNAQNGATALALLPFLGSGQTHVNGQYKTQVDKGIKFLLRSMKVEKEMGSFWEMGGTMYSHGLAAIVLCEAYGMTHDPELRLPAQQALNFIVAAQNTEGGWRYNPGQPGDTSVVGWQLMALTSGRLAYLEVPPDTFRKAGYFLDFVQSEDGSEYGYTSSGTGAATSAIGLLSRMYLGWKQDHPALLQGVHTLGSWGPGIDRGGPPYNINNMYYNYYATQVMHHHGGEPWKKWNEVMREYLIRTQSQRGHEIGSWFLPGSDLGAGDGGRVYCTAMAAMILEVYYRHMPLYRQQSTQQALRN